MHFCRENGQGMDVNVFSSISLLLFLVSHASITSKERWSDHVSFFLQDFSWAGIKAAMKDAFVLHFACF